MARARRRFAIASVFVFAAFGCGGSVSSESPNDGGATTDSGVGDTGAFDSGAVDSRTTPDTLVADTTDTALPTDAPPGTALVRIADMLWSSSPANIRVCLVDETTGKATLIEPPGITGGLAYQTVTTYVPAPLGAGFTVHIVAAGADCSATELIPSGAPLDGPIEAGKTYLLGISREPGEGDNAMVRLWPDLDPPDPTTAKPAVSRAFNMLYTISRANISIDFGSSTLLFPSLAVGDVPHTSSAGTPSPEGYVEQAGDLVSIDVTLTGGPTVGHFPAGFFFTERNTFYVTGVPVGGPVAPQIVYCHDDLSDGALTRCDVVSVGP